MSHKQPLYSIIQNYIVEQIVSGKWPERYQIPPERELAEQFQVSRITAKNAILRLVADGYLERYRGKGTFVSEGHPGKRKEVVTAAKQQSKRLIGFMMPWIEFQYANILFAGIVSELDKAGYHVVFKRIRSDAEDESSAVKELLELPIDGLIAAASKGEHFNEDLVRLVLNQFPVVMAEKYMRDLKAYGVYCDTEQAGYLMGQYLAERGMERIALLSYPEQFTLGVKERIFGFQSAIVHHGIPPISPDRLLVLPAELLDGSRQLDSTYRCDDIVRFLQEQPDLQAIATIDAWLARLVCLACTELGRDDLVVVCCDEPALPPSAAVHPEAYVDQFPYRMGTVAAQMMIEAIQGQPPRHLVISPQLVRWSP